MPSKNRTSKFIDYLDIYKEKPTCNNFDYSLLIAAAKFDYSSGAKWFDQTNFKPIQMNTANNNYFHMYDASLWNTTNNYEEWQSNHEIVLNLPSIDDIKNKPKHGKIHIDMSINTIDDIISILDKYPYNEENEYNFDLKAMHSIREELVLLKNMIGMETIKKSILSQLIYFIQGLHLGKNSSDYKHTVIYGSPGTGKTEIAKIIGKMYAKVGILRNNVFKKVTRNDLIAGYLGQTAIKTKKVIEECLGGVLFIDEAYSLANNDREDSYSKECLDILCEAMSDHKDDLMVIIAGYEDELNETFFRVNRGLRSRFIWRFKMDPYKAKELMQIFQKMVFDQNWQFETEESSNEKWFDDKKDNFKNYGRDMELLFTFVKVSHGIRIYGLNVDKKKRITKEDMISGYNTFLENNNTKKDPHFMHSIYV